MALYRGRVDLVLAVFLRDPLRTRYAYDLWRETRVPPRVIQRVLWSLAGEGWLDRAPQLAGGTGRRGRPLPVRVGYTLTQHGQIAAQRRLPAEAGGDA